MFNKVNKSLGKLIIAGIYKSITLFFNNKTLSLVSLFAACLTLCLLPVPFIGVQVNFVGHGDHGAGVERPVRLQLALPRTEDCRPAEGNPTSTQPAPRLPG